MTEQTIGTARIDLVANADGVEVATQKARQSISTMTREAQAEYNKLTAAQRRQVDSLLRHADQLGMTRAQQVAYNAALKTSGPLYDEIARRVRAHEAALASNAAAMDLGARSHKQLQAALRGTPAQISDIVVALQGGQRPMTVFLQQGLQLRDMFGSWQQVASGMGTALMNMVNPMTLAAGAAGALLLAWHQGGNESREFHRALVMSGNVAGLTAGQLQVMAREISNVAGTQREASAVLAQMAGSAHIAAGGMASYAQTAIALNQAVGKSVDETVREFEQLGQSPVEASAKLNEQYRYLTAAVFEQIRALEEQGNADAAAELAQNAYRDAMNERARSVNENLGYLERAWRGVAGAAAKAWDAMLNVGRDIPLEEQVATQRQTVQHLEAAVAKSMELHNGKVLGKTGQQLEAAKQLLETLESELKLQNEKNQAIAEGQKQEQEKIKAEQSWAQLVKDNRSAAVKLAEEELRIRQVGIAAGKSELEIQQQLQAFRDKHERSSGSGARRRSGGSGGRSASDAELASIRARIAAQNELLERLRLHGSETQRISEGERLVLKLQQELAGKLNERQRAAKQLALEEAKRLVLAEKSVQAEREQIQRQKEYTQAISALRKERAKQVAEQARAVEALDKGNRSLQEETELIGKTRQEQAKILIERQRNILATKEQQLAELALAEDAQQHYSQKRYLLEQEIEKRRELIDLIGGKLDAQDQAEAQKQLVQRWDQVSKTIGDTLADYIMGGGKDAAQYLERLFATLVLRPVVEAAAGTVVGWFGSGAQGRAGSAGGAGLPPGLGNVASGGLSALSGLLGGVGTTAGTFTGALGYGLANPLSGFATGFANLGAGGMAAGLGNILGAAVPWIGAALAVASLIRSMDGSGDPHRGAGGSYNAGYSSNYQRGVEGYDPRIGSAVQDLARGVGDSLAQLLRNFGVGGDVQVRTGWADDFDGEGTSWGDFAIRVGDRILADWAQGDWQSRWTPREFAADDKGWEEYVTAVAQSYVQALREVDMPAWARSMLDAVGEGANLDQINQALGAINVARETIGGWTTYLREFANVGSESMSRLMQSAGGFDALAAGVTTFVDRYYSEQERMELAQRQLTDALAQHNLALPESKEAWRALVQQTMDAGEQGAALAATLLGLSGSFADYAEAAEQAQLAAVQQLYNLAELSGDQVYKLLRDGMLGRIGSEDLGAQLAEQIIGGIHNSVASGFAQQITDLFTGQIITPVLQAAAAGAVTSAAVSQAAIDSVVAQAQASMAALQAIINDAGFQSLLAQVREAVAGVAGSVGTAPKTTAALAGGMGGMAAATERATGATKQHTDAQSQHASLLRELYRLEGRFAELRQLELQQIDPANRAMQQRIWLLEREQAIAAKLYDLDNQMLQLQGDTAALRERQLQEMIRSFDRYALAGTGAAGSLGEAAKELTRVQQLAKYGQDSAGFISQIRPEDRRSMFHEGGEAFLRQALDEAMRSAASGIHQMFGQALARGDVSEARYEREYQRMLDRHLDQLDMGIAQAIADGHEASALRALEMVNSIRGREGALRDGKFDGGSYSSGPNTSITTLNMWEAMFGKGHRLGAGTPAELDAFKRLNALRGNEGLFAVDNSRAVKEQAEQTIQQQRHRLRELEAQIARHQAGTQHHGVAGEADLARARHHAAQAEALQAQADGIRQIIAEQEKKVQDAIQADLDALIKRQKELWAAQDAAAVKAERDGLWKQWLQAIGDQGALRDLERAALNEANRALFDQINAQVDLNRARGEYEGLWKQWLQLTDEAAAREIERAALLSDTSRALYDQIHAYRELKSAVESATGAISNEIERLLGVGKAENSRSYLQAQFAVLTAQARAGDANAAQQLPAIVQALEEAIKGSAGSASEVRTAQIAMASSLQETQAALDAMLKRAAQFDPDSRAPAERAQSAPGDVSVTPPPRVLDQAGQSPALLAEVQLLRQELKAAVEAGFGANVRQVKRAADTLEKFAREGLEVH